MTGWTKSLGALALVMMLLTAAGVATAQAQPASSATKIVTINMVDLFDRLDAKKDGDKAIAALQQDLQKQVDSKQEEVKRLRDELQQYKQGSDIYNDTQNKLMTKAMELQAFQQYYIPQKQMMEMRIRTAALYQQINKAIAAYAQSHGIALVLVADNADLTDAKTREELVSKITIRKVAYSDPSLDITSVIVDKMNADYKLGGAAK